MVVSGAGALQAVVLCGGLGNRMTDLTDYIPKCMLPIAGVILVVAEALLAEIKQLLSGCTLPPLPNLHIEFVSLGTDAENWGTADVLRHIADRIKKDFVVVSGDFVSDMSLSPMLALHSAENSALTCLLTDRFITGPVPGLKARQSVGCDFIALAKNNQLLFIGSEEDYDEEVPMDLILLKKCRSALFTTAYNDCHVYIMKKWILNFIKMHRNFTSLKADVIPYILKKQFTKDGLELVENEPVDPLSELVQKLSFGTAIASRKQPAVRCFAYILTQENGYIIAHVNTIGAYFEVNKAIVRFLSSRFSEKFPTGQTVDTPNTPTGFECYVSAAAQFAVVQHTAAEEGEIAKPLLRSEKPIIKRSVIGANSIIGMKTKIINSLVMDGCIIGP
ncbi:unnamed protein product, partial [Gongylonema pulchrum]|uniref:Translation initiation factor eIF2B subunit gamma n=1 Tax=Gongylonema pulchrum TaxID=637853 RepID=A0A183ECV6_9BILA